MTFGRTWDDGYIVRVLYDMGEGLRWYSLRNFGDRQGDSIAFKEFDCPNLTDVQVRMLIKNFDKNRKYIRIDSRHFKVQQ